MLEYWILHASIGHLITNVVFTAATAIALRRFFNTSWGQIVLTFFVGIVVGGIFHFALIPTPIVGASAGPFALLGMLLEHYRWKSLLFVLLIVAGHAILGTWVGLLIHVVGFLSGYAVAYIIRR